MESDIPIINMKKLLLDNKKVASVACGQSFTIVLTDDGEVRQYLKAVSIDVPAFRSKLSHN